MDLNVTKLLETQFYTLPLVAQDIINEREWASEIQKLETEFRLHKDQAETIESITMLTMIGFADVEHYANNILEEAKLQPNIANEIGKRINLNVFEPLKQAIIEAEELQSEDLDDDSLLVLDDARIQKVQEGLDDLDLTKESDLAAKELLDQIENPENHIPQNAPGKAQTDLQNNVDGIMQPGETRPQSQPVAQQAGQNPNTTQETKRPATHMRTLKSDIVKQKLVNPSWQPEVNPKTDQDIANITKSALETAHEKSSHQAQSDKYREVI